MDRRIRIFLPTGAEKEFIEGVGACVSIRSFGESAKWALVLFEQTDEIRNREFKRTRTEAYCNLPFIIIIDPPAIQYEPRPR